MLTQDDEFSDVLHQDSGIGHGVHHPSPQVQFDATLLRGPQSWPQSWIVLSAALL
jgi:hypothetical protein